MKDAFLAFVLMVACVVLIFGFIWLCVVTNGLPMLIILVAILWSAFYSLIKAVKD